MSMSDLRTSLTRLRAAWPLLRLFLFVALVCAGVAWAREHSARRMLEGRLETTVRLNDSTTARLATTEAAFREYRAVKDAAKQLDGKLIAGVQLRVAPETVYVPLHEVATVADSDSTRRAHFVDSSNAAYRVEVDAVAPPFPAPLQLGARVTTPEFRPEIGFVQRADGTYAVVSWAGHRVETERAFFRPPHAHRLVVVAELEARTNPLAVTPSVQGAAAVATELHFEPTTVRLRAGFDGRPFVGVGVRRSLGSWF
jgi:hypothetical protein